MVGICWVNVLETVISFLFTSFVLYGLYRWITNGKIQIPEEAKDFDQSHNKRHRIKVINKGRRTLRGLTPCITFVNLDEDDLEQDVNSYFISPSNYVSIKREFIIYDNGSTHIDLNPKQEIDVDLLHFENNEIIIPSEHGYTDKNKCTKARACIKKIDKPYQFYLEFFAIDHNSVFILSAILAKFLRNIPKSERFYFEIRLNKDRTDVEVERY